MQTTLPPFANNMREGWTKIVREEGYAGYVYLITMVPFSLAVS